MNTQGSEKQAIGQHQQHAAFRRPGKKLSSQTFPESLRKTVPNPQTSANPDPNPSRTPLSILLNEHSTPAIPLTQLKELVAFRELGTLTAVSKALHLTQPTVTRGIQQLEHTIGVPLFDHRPNRLVLTDVGRVASDRARAMLELCNDSVATIRGFASTQAAATPLEIGATLPGPLIWLSHSYKPAKRAIPTEVDGRLVRMEDVVRLLRQYRYSLVFTSREIFTHSGEAVESTFLGTEKLAVRINKFSALAARKRLSFADLRDQRFLVVTVIGPWKKIIEDNIPGAHFMYQQDSSSLEILQRSSSFPTFVTNLSQRPSPDDRVTIPITDRSNRVDVYATYLVSQKKRVMPLLRRMSRQWPTDILGCSA